ncbi:hypothetical protein [Pandoraea sp. NPDC090278]|uniref:hypothetical protein n=1 Tax=Pandoraea sp. NPDC090278 TaxID=3364391 RepID=UPI00383B2F54
MHSQAPDVVALQPVETPAIKSNYTLSEFLYAVAASSEPFRHTGESLLQMYTLVTGEEVCIDTRKSISQWTEALDLATGLVPDVGISRLPGDAAGIVADSIEGRPIAPDRLINMIQASDSRNLASRGVVRKSPDFSMIEAKWRQTSKGKAHADASRRSALARAEAIARRRNEAQIDAQRDRIASVLEEDMRLAAISPDDTPAHHKPSLPQEWRIEGEDTHLDGYVQSLAPDKLPTDQQRRIVMIDGYLHLRGATGYYRATRGRSLDHWLVSAPRGSGHAAPVPVHFDVATGRWYAEAPLRLCGGGCGPSREATPDSISLDREKVRDAVAHLHNEALRDAIVFAFDDLAALHLSRSNRPDLQTTRDNSIVDHRTALRASMKRIKRNLPLVRQQEEAAMITAMHYHWNPYAEAFCQENAEILFHFLRVNGVPLENLRLITVKPKNRPPHVLVLYTESERLIGLLEEATPHPPLNVGPDGLIDMLFAREAYEARDSTVLLDPWSRSRATSFAHATHAVAMVDTLDDAFAEIGHRPGSLYWVSITRPLGQRRGSSSSLGSAGSGGSSGGSGSSVSGSMVSVRTSGTGGSAGAAGSAV